MCCSMRSPANEIDVAVDYSGTLWANRMQRSDVLPREQVLAELSRWLADDARHPHAGRARIRKRLCAGDGAQDSRDGSASARSPTSRATPARSTIAGDYEFFARPEWTALVKAYGLQFRASGRCSLNSCIQAVASGQVDVISAYTSDGQIAKLRSASCWTIPSHAIPPYDAILLLSPRRANDEKLIAALKPLLGAIPVAS